MQHKICRYCGYSITNMDSGSVLISCWKVYCRALYVCAQVIMNASHGRRFQGTPINIKALNTLCWSVAFLYFGRYINKISCNSLNVYLWNAVFNIGCCILLGSMNEINFVANFESFKDQFDMILWLVPVLIWKIIILHLGKFQSIEINTCFDLIWLE